MAGGGGLQRAGGWRRRGEPQARRSRPRRRRVTGDSIVGLIDGYADLAESLGADADAIAEKKADFETAVASFEEATAAKPGLTALAISPWEDTYAVAVPEYAPELLDLQSWGLDVIAPTTPDPDFPYWQSLSFENADTYQPDLLLFDDRNHPGNEETLAEQPIASKITAFAAGATTTWPAYWLHTYSDYTAQLERLTEVIDKADPDLTSLPRGGGVATRTGRPPSTAGRRVGLAGGLVIAVVALALACLASVAIGSRVIDPFNGSATDVSVVLDMRVPRTIIGVLVGAALGLGGALMQGVTRNPLADPGSWASTRARRRRGARDLLLGVAAALGYVWFAFLGAAVASVLVYLLGSLGREGATPVKLALAGAAVAPRSVHHLRDPVDRCRRLDEFRVWMVGALAGRDWTVLARSPFFVVGTSWRCRPADR